MKTKNINLKILLQALVLISLSAFAANKVSPTSTAKSNFNYNSFVASEFQKTTLELKKTEDIKNKFLHSKQEKAEFDQWHKKNPIKWTAVGLKRKGTQVFLNAKKQSIVLDFKAFDQNKLFVNNVSVKISDKKTFIDYKTEILKILKTKKTALNYFFSNAYAQEVNDSLLASYIAWRNVGYGTSTISVPWADSYISAVIRGSYAEEQREIMSSNNSTSPGDRSITWDTLGFECSNNRVSRVGQFYVIDRNIPKNAYSRSGYNLTREGDGFRFTYTIQSSPDKVCTSILDANGNVISKSGDSQVLDLCPGELENAFENSRYPFGEFPLAADLCCQRQGCYEEVVQERNNLRDRLLGTYRRGQESSDRASEATDGN